MHRPVFWLVLALSLIAAEFAWAQPSDRAQVLAAMCAKVPCRKGGRPLLLRMSDDRGFETKTQAFPYLDDKGTVIVYPGETITIGYDKNGDTPSNPILLKVTDPDGPVDLGASVKAAATLSFTLKQDDAKPGMMLTVANGVAATLKYDAVMLVPMATGKVEPVPTSTCPLMSPQGSSSTFSGFESWPHPLVMMVITNIHTLPKDAPMVCN